VDTSHSSSRCKTERYRLLDDGTVAREEKYYWVGEILALRYYLFGKKEEANSLPRTLEEARDARVGVIRQDVIYQHLAEAGFKNLVVVNHPARNLAMLERDRIDLFPFSRFGIGLFAAKNDVDPASLIGMVKLEDISTGMYMVLSLGTDEAVFQRLTNAYAKVKQSGRYDEIMAPLLDTGRLLDVAVIR